MLYVGGNLYLDGSILCNGLAGGNGGGAKDSDSRQTCACGGAGGGGGGGGAIYIVHFGAQIVAGNLNVNGGAGGTAGPSNGDVGGFVSTNGESGAIGTTTIKQYEKGMVK